MKIAHFLTAALALGGAAVSAQETQRETEIVNLAGEKVDSLLLRYDFDALWALGDQNVLLRDSFRDHYLVTFETECAWLDKQRSIQFVPALNGRVRATKWYEARDTVGPPCDIAQIRQVASRDAAEALVGIKIGG